MSPALENPKSMIMKSSAFFNPLKTFSYSVEYEDRNTPQRDVNSLQKVIEKLRQQQLLVTLYTAFPDSTGTVIIKLKQRIPQEDTEAENLFFFVYNNYNACLEARKQILQEKCAELEGIQKCRVKSLVEVLMGGTYAIKNTGGYYSRVRIVKISLGSKKVTYWALDEGRFGVCKPTDLLRMNYDLNLLEMLVVPGVFETAPEVDKLKKFESERFCLAKVVQPKLEMDFAPRLITLQ